MKANGRIVVWEHFIREINAGHGTLIVERFSFKGPIRMWWTMDDVYEVSPYPLVDWLTIASEASFDAVRDWCHSKYTSNTGSALLVDGSKKQWRTIRGKGHSRFKRASDTLKCPRHEDCINCHNINYAHHQVNESYTCRDIPGELRTMEARERLPWHSLP